VLRPFSYDEAHPYAAGQHRGVDIGAGTAGENVVAPAAGIVSFAGTVPTNGKSVTIETADGYSVTLTHLGAIRVVKGATVAERDTIGTVGPSGTPEDVGPYVHLGIRVADDPNGYVDPLGLLPPPDETGATQGGPTASQTGSGSGSSAAPASGASGSTGASAAPVSEPTAPGSAGPRVSTTRGSTVAPGRSDVHARGHERAQESRATAQQGRSSERRTEDGRADVHASHHDSTPQRRVSAPTRSAQRPVVETAAPAEPTGLDAGHAIQSSLHAVHLPLRPGVVAPLALVLNGAAALVALAAAVAAGRRRRRAPAGAVESAQVVHLTRPAVERRAA
jgi:hypothetical protein